MKNWNGLLSLATAGSLLFFSVPLVAMQSRGLASIDKSFAGVECGKEVMSQIHQWENHLDWTRRVDSASGAKVYASPTHTVGTWLELQVSADHTIEVKHSTPQKVVTIRWETKQCNETMAARDRVISAEVMRNAFTDDKFQALLDEQKTGILYFWSPQMNNSKKGVAAIRKVASKLKVPVTFVMDPYANKILAQKVKGSWNMSDKDMQRMESEELFYRGALNHYPGFLVFKNKKILGTTYEGVRTEKRYATVIKRMLASR